MTLLLDIGNSRIKWARLTGDHLAGAGAVTHRGVPTDAVLTQLAGIGAGTTRAIAASVGPRDLTGAVLDLLASRGLQLTLAASEGSALGVTNGYRVPAQLGVDRWLAVLAGWGRYRSPLCIANVGTAVTVDVVSGEGYHLGGLILPGPELMAGALHGSTGRISEATGLTAPQAGGAAWATDTAEAIRLGAVLALAAVVERARDALARVLPGQPPTTLLLVTGGAATVLQPHLPSRFEHRPLLVLEGLALRYAGVLVNVEAPAP